MPTTADLKRQAHATVKHQTSTRSAAEEQARAKAAAAAAKAKTEEAKKIDAANRAQVESQK
ncbi:hypothetical protein D3C78_1943980 [compost metagenome]